jgi:uncharacterized protein
VTRRFPSSEFDVLVVIEGKTLLARESIGKLRDLVTDLQLIDGTRGIVSIFSARQPPEDGAIPPPLFPDQLPEGAAYDAMINRVMGNEIIRGKLLSTDGELTLVVLALDPSVVDFRLNMFLNVMTPLIMVISFSDSMQLTFATRDRLLAGQNIRDALRNAILIVGPACVLTHATAAVSFLALLFSESELIRSFGEAGLIATIIALGAVLILMPLLGILLLRGETSFATKVAGSDFAVEALRRFCGFIASRVRHPGVYSLIGLIVVVGLGAIDASLEPRYRLADQVPDKQQAVAASSRLDAKLTGANPIDVLIEFPQGASLYAADTLAVIAEVQSILEKQAGVGNVWSLETLRRWLIEAGKPDVSTLKQYVDMLPKHLTRRFISADQDAVVVSGRIPDVDASRLLPVVDALGKSLDKVRVAYPGYSISVTGLAAIAARNSANMIEKLNRELTFEFVFVAAFIGAAFRSFVVMLAAIGISDCNTPSSYLEAIRPAPAFISIGFS